MSYIQNKVILKEEKNVSEVLKNPIFLILSWVWGILGCWLLLIPTFKAIGATINFCTTEFCITEKRIIEKRGWLNTVCDEMSLDKIENVTLYQTFWGKIFNYGDIYIQGANRNNVNFVKISNPEKIRKYINEIRQA